MRAINSRTRQLASLDGPANLSLAYLSSSPPQFVHQFLEAHNELHQQKGTEQLARPLITVME